MTSDRPRMMIFAAASTCGVLLSVVAQMLADSVGLVLSPLWAQETASNHQHVLSAFGWWAVVAAGFIGSFVAGLIVQDPPGPRRRRLVRGSFAVILFVLLAALPYVITAGHEENLRQSLQGEAIAFGLGLLSAFCGSWFSLPR